MGKKLLSLFLAILICVSVFPLSIFAASSEASASTETGGHIVVSNTQAFAGSTVTLNVDISDNPGIAGAKIFVYYNAKLTLTSASVGETFAELDYTAPPALANGCVFNWDSLNQEVTEDGTLLTLTFDISNSALANEKLDVAVSYTYGDIYNKDLDSLSFEVTNGYVKIIDYIPGDVNGDQTVNGKDVTLIRRYNAGYDVTINKLAADVNNDGTINGKDVTLIRRYNAGYDVELMPSTPKCDHSLVSVSAKGATCTENGNIGYWVCSGCNKYFSDENAVSEITLLETVVYASGHTTVVIPERAPSCTQMGKTEGSLCTSCNTIVISQSDIPTIGHNYVSGICSECGDKEDKTKLEVTSVSVDKTLLKANDQVTFSAVTNKNGENITFTVVIYLNGIQVATLSNKGSVKYIPTSSGRYDAEVSVTDDGEDIFTYYLKSCFEVKPYWSLSKITESSNNVSLGSLLSFNAQIDGDVSDLSYNITVYKDGVSYYSIEDSSKIDFYPNVAGSYYAVITATDSYGESQTAQSGTVVVKAQNSANPTLSINYGTTLNIDELNSKDGDEVIVPAGKNIILNWNKLSTDSYYTLDVYARNNDSDTYDEVFKNYTSNSYTIASSNLISGHEYCATVRRYDASGNSLGTIRVEFTVGGANSIMLEKRFEVTSPVDDGVYAQNDITVQWTKLNYASKYVLSLEYHCGKSYHDVLENIEISNTQNSYTISKSLLHQGCKHRLKVYAYDSLGNELYESIVFRMEGDTAIFELDKPEITATYFYEDWTDDMKSYPTYEDIVVTWTDIPAASYYSISIDSHYTVIDDPVLINADNITDNTFTIPVSALVSGCVYSVRVSAYCSDGHKYTSDRGYFRVPYSNGTTIQGPELVSHDFSKDENNPTTIVEQALTIEWKPVSAAVSYNIYWSEEGYEDWPEFEAKGLTTTSVTIPKEHVSSWGEQSDYILKIVAKDSNGITEGAYYYVRVVESALEAPVLISPTLATDDEETLPSFEDDITLTWNAVEGAVSYKVRVWECYDGDLFELISQDGITETSFDIPLDELYFGGVFRISIRANDQYGGCSKSSKYYFQVGESDYLGLSVDNWNPTYEADYKFTYVETVGDWSAKTSASWITLSSTNGTGTTRLKVSVTENTGSSARSGLITFTNEEGGTAVLSITQDANNSSQTSVIQITSPSQNEVVENDMLTVKWSVKYGYAYFEVDLFDLTNDKAVYHQSDITSLYQQIPASYIEQGHTYQLTLSIFDYSENKGAETSIIFKVEGDIIPPDDDTNNDEDDGDDENLGNNSQVCSHTFYQKKLVETVYTNLIKTSSVHDGYSLYNKVCMSCGVSLGTEKISFSNNTHSINSKEYCSCGFTDTYGYTSWSATNASNQKVIVYQTPESTSQYGYINAGETVTVLAECCGRYLVQYTLDSGLGIKEGYVNKYSLSEEKPSYSIYINDEYFNAPSNAMVAEKNTYYQIYIENNKTNELIKYGTDGLICVSSDENIVTVGDSGTLVIRGVGSANIKLMQDGEVLDQLTVYGCVENSRITNYSATRDSELYAEGFAPNCRLKVFNYESMFIADDSWTGGGYYIVTFDVYNDVPTIFCVAAFNSDGEIVQQKLIDGYSADMLDEVASAFIHFGDLLNGKLISGESETYQTKTSVTLKVPLGGYVDFLTLSNSNYMVYANVLSGIVVGAMETADAWVDFVKVASSDIELDEMKFAEELLKLICEETNMDADNVVSQIIGIILDAEDYAALATELMGYLGDKGVSMANLFEILANCSESALDSLRSSIAKGTVDIALGAVPPAKVIKKLTDAFVASLQYAIVIKDIASMVNNSNDFLIIVYPASPVY